MKLCSIPTNLLLQAALLLLNPSLASAATITLSIAPQAHIPNPAVLRSSTHATLTSLGVSQSAPLSTSNTFVFRNVTPGSYLCDIHCSTHGFSPLRVDVLPVEGGGQIVGKGERIRAWETFRGNDWENKGEELKQGAGGAFSLLSYGAKVVYVERGSFSIISILKNPMILLGLVSMVLFIAMPKLVENMDPETRAEFEEQSRENPMNSLMSGPQPGSNPMGNFDMAGFLAGQSSSSGSKGSDSEPAPSGKRGGKK